MAHTGLAMEDKDHWEKVYSSKSNKEVSWFQEHAQLSLKLIRDAANPAAARVIDVGGGASTWVDDLLAANFRDLTVLDLSAAALVGAQNRLGAQAARVQWLEADVLDVNLPHSHYDVWHDRAVFHFLMSAQQREAYVRQVMNTVKPGGRVIIATFAQDGPDNCSGLPVMRYSAANLHAEFGEPFELLGHEQELHQTPNGNEQKFVYCFCKKKTHG